MSQAVIIDDVFQFSLSFDKQRCLLTELFLRLLSVSQALADALIARIESLKMLSELCLTLFEQLLVGPNEILKELWRDIHLMTSLLEVSLSSDLAVLMHLDHAKDHLLQVFNVQLLFSFFFIVASSDCKHLLAFEVLSCHILKAGSGPITKLNDRRCIDQVNGVTQATLQDF